MQGGLIRIGFRKASWRPLRSIDVFGIRQIELTVAGGQARIKTCSTIPYLSYLGRTGCGYIPSVPSRRKDMLAPQENASDCVVWTTYLVVERWSATAGRNRYVSDGIRRATVGT